MSEAARTTARRVMAAVTPPIVQPVIKEAVRRVRRRPRSWEYLPGGWSSSPTVDSARGWDVPGIPEGHARQWAEFATAVAAPRPLSVAPEHPVNPSIATSPYGEVDVDMHHVVMTVAYAVGLAARGRTRLSVLDWGGGVGQYSLVLPALYPDLEFEHHVRDLPHMTAQGRRLAPHVAFHDDDSCLDRTYDLVLSSSSLQYSHDWRSQLAALARATEGLLFVSQIPVVHRGSTFAIIQRPYDHGYDTEYVGWCFARTELLGAADGAGLSLVREVLHGFKPPVHGAPEQPEYRGYLFRPAR